MSAKSEIFPSAPIVLKSELFAALLIAITVCLFRWKVFSQFGSAFLGGSIQDPGLYLWLVRTNILNFQDWFGLLTENFPRIFPLDGGTPLLANTWFDTKAFFPYGSALGFSDNFLLPSAVILLLETCGLSFAAAWNLQLLVATFLSGYFTYLLASKVSGAFFPSVLSGVGFVTLPCYSEHLGHPQLQFTLFIPLSVLLFLRYLEAPSLNRAGLIGVCIGAAFATTVYYAVLCMLFLSFLYLGFLLATKGTITLGSTLKLAAGGAGGLVPSAALVFPYLGVRSVFGERTIRETYSFAATPLSYLSAPNFNFLYGAATKGFSHLEAHLFLSLTILVLTFAYFGFLFKKNNLTKVAIISAVILIGSLVSVFAVNKNPVLNFSFPYKHYIAAILVALSFLIGIYFLVQSRHVKSKSEFALPVIFAFAALSCGLLSFGPLGDPVLHQPALGIHRLFYEYFPGMNSIRAVGRIGAYALFALCILLCLCTEVF